MPEIGRFFTHDRFAETYYPLNPYQYVANSPIGLIDINGDSIWVTQNKGVWTIHITGKVLNLTDEEAPDAEDFTNRLKAAFSKAKGVELDIRFSDASSIDEVDKSDHLIVIVDDVDDGRGISTRGGKVAYIEGGGAKNSVLNTMVHEGGDLMGLNHGFATETKDDDDINNMMNYTSKFASKDTRNHFTLGQAALVIAYWRKGKLNFGSNSETVASDDPPQFVPNWLYNMYHSSTPEAPYKGAVKQGDKIPKPISE